MPRDLAASIFAKEAESFGPGHPNVATLLNNLAQLLQDTNRLAEAEPSMRRALAIFEESLGTEHPSTKAVRGNLEALLAAIEAAKRETPERGGLLRRLFRRR